MSYITEEYLAELEKRQYGDFLLKMLRSHKSITKAFIETIRSTAREVAENVEQWVKEDDTWRRYQ